MIYFSYWICFSSFEHCEFKFINFSKKYSRLLKNYCFSVCENWKYSWFFLKDNTSSDRSAKLWYMQEKIRGINYSTPKSFFTPGWQKKFHGVKNIWHKKICRNFSYRRYNRSLVCFKLFWIWICCVFYRYLIAREIITQYK